MSRNGLHTMAKPRDASLHAMAELEWLGRGRRPEALHWTVMPDPATDDWTIETIVRCLDKLDAAPVALTFDRAKGKVGGTAEISCGKTPPAATCLVRAICQVFQPVGIALHRRARPHVTLDYKWDSAAFAQPIAPIVWDVDRVELIESIPARRKHISHGSWPLVPRQGTLFPLRTAIPTRAPAAPSGAADRH